MDGHIIEERQVGIAITCHVSRFDIILYEVTEQRCFEPPLCITCSTRRNGAEIGGNSAAERHHLIIAVELRVYKLEVYEQAFFVLNDFRLLSGHTHIGSVAAALIVYYQSELRRNLRLDDIGRKRIVSKHVALHEVYEIKLRRGLHCHVHWIEVARYNQIGVRVEIRKRA